MREWMGMMARFRVHGGVPGPCRSAVTVAVCLLLIGLLARLTDG